MDGWWRKYVLARYGNKCLMCKSRGGKKKPLHAHHILGKGAYPHLRHDMTNGIPLCAKHHDMVHKDTEFRDKMITALHRMYPDIYRWISVNKSIPAEPISIAELKQRRDTLRAFAKNAIACSPLVQYRERAAKLHDPISDRLYSRQPQG